MIRNTIRNVILRFKKRPTSAACLAPQHSSCDGFCWVPWANLFAHAHPVTAGSLRTLILGAAMLVLSVGSVNRALAAPAVRDVKTPSPKAPVRASRENGVLTNRGAVGVAVDLARISTLRVHPFSGYSEYFEPGERPTTGSGAGSVAGGGPEVTCDQGAVPMTNIYTDADFSGGSFILQLGFAENESAGVSFVLHPDEFPVQIKAMECIFARTNTSISMRMEYAVSVWEGTPDTGRHIITLSSLDGDLQPLVMNPGTQGTNIQVIIDPNDANQIFVDNDNGSNTFTVLFRILEHNSPSNDPCVTPPPADENIFPVVDVSGLASANGNWLGAINCGPLGCPSGFHSFSNLGQCTPSGDWVIRVTTCVRERVVFGACCRPDATCDDGASNIDCQAQGATFMGEDTLCADVTCPAPVGACCLFGTCLSDVSPDTCAGTGGTFAGSNSSCTDDPCTTGACCKPDGSCEDLIAVSCAIAGGTFEGTTTSCDRFNCPQPAGSCCINGVCVAGQFEDVCLAVGTWNGPGSQCDPDPCLDCPTGTILEANPISGVVDARQPHPVNDNSPGARQGIGGAGEPIVLTLDVTGAPAGCFTLCETDREPGFGPNAIASVVEGPAGVYSIQLARPITTGAVTTIAYGGGDRVVYTSHPANVNADSQAGAQDILAVIDCLNGVDPGTSCPWGDPYSQDIDHNGGFGPSDILRVIDLLNGAGTYAHPWVQTPMPVNGTCP